MSERSANIFVGSLGGVLEAMAEQLSVDLVVSPGGHLRNMRLEHRLRESGVAWINAERGSECMEAIAALGNPGVCVVAGCPWRIPQTVIDRCDVVINVHPGDLLCCRGPQPIEAALLHGHRQLGVCVHIIDSEAMDAGPLLARELLEVNPAMGYHWHRGRIDEACRNLAGRVCARLAAGEKLAGENWDVDASHWYERASLEDRKRLYSAPDLHYLYSDPRDGP